MPLVTNVPTGLTVEPDLYVDYDSTNDVPTVVHEVIGTSVPDFTIAAARPRIGQHAFLCLSQELADQVRALHLRPGPFVLSEPTSPLPSMTYHVTGGVRVVTDATTPAVAMVTVDYAEVVL